MDFLIGGAAAMCAGVFSNPFDVIKTRQQLQGELQKNTKSKLPYRGLGQAIVSIVRAEGLKGLQKGLGSALGFQFVMNSTRLGLYETVDRFGWTRYSETQNHSPVLCVLWGGLAGIAGSAIGCPFYMIKTQIQAQSHGQFAVGYQHDHRGTVSALITTYQTQGFKGLWRGFTGIVPRTAVGSAIQLTTFTKCKDFFMEYETFKNSTFLTATAASMVSGFFLVVGMTPFDVVATRLFNQGIDSNGKGLLYRNIFDCFIKTFKIEGMRGLYKGFVANYWRAAPHTILNLTFWEQFKKWKDLYLSDEANMYFE
ncbi:Solute carrier family 25 member 35 [Pseudolycoriella hygida]|uniref:Solute carrier family 25 member 35 n=1 Tax=Pseudolycoriella hygida TaxID=35572 RepID=A0A9Q0N8H6_9DIPT|nr:Solute carrier family 25 member 35 [Pseudolycoriella hygida]